MKVSDLHDSFGGWPLSITHTFFSLTRILLALAMNPKNTKVSLRLKYSLFFFVKPLELTANDRDSHSHICYNEDIFEIDHNKFFDERS